MEGDAWGHTRHLEADKEHTVNFNHENIQLIALNEGALTLLFTTANCSRFSPGVDVRRAKVQIQMTVCTFKIQIQTHTKLQSDLSGMKKSESESPL